MNKSTWNLTNDTQPIGSGFKLHAAWSQHAQTDLDKSSQRVLVSNSLVNQSIFSSNPKNIATKLFTFENKSFYMYKLYIKNIHF